MPLTQTEMAALVELRDQAAANLDAVRIRTDQMLDDARRHYEMACDLVDRYCAGRAELAEPSIASVAAASVAARLVLAEEAECLARTDNGPLAAIAAHPMLLIGARVELTRNGVGEYEFGTVTGRCDDPEKAMVSWYTDGTRPAPAVPWPIAELRAAPAPAMPTRRR
jgi:hypothetical protein